MKTVHFRCWSWFTSIAGILFGILRYIKNLVFKKPKKNEEAVHATTKDPTPVTIFVDENTDTSQGNMYPRASRMEGQDQFVDWNNWGHQDEPSQVPSTEDVSANDKLEDIDLFQDMEPKIRKPKIVRVRSKPTNAEERLSQGFSVSNKFGMEAGSVHIESELGTWVDEPSGWDEEMDDAEISQETAKMIKERKRAERERRAYEQQRKKEEREAMRAAKKPLSQIGVKLS